MCFVIFVVKSGKEDWSDKRAKFICIFGLQITNIQTHYLYSSIPCIIHAQLYYNPHRVYSYNMS